MCTCVCVWPSAEKVYKKAVKEVRNEARAAKAAAKALASTDPTPAEAAALAAAGEEEAAAPAPAPVADKPARVKVARPSVPVPESAKIGSAAAAAPKAQVRCRAPCRRFAVCIVHLILFVYSSALFRACICVCVHLLPAEEVSEHF